MKRPITSPWSAVLTSSPTITLIPLAFSRASSAPEISLWSVTAIAPRPARLGGREQHLDRRRAVVRVVGVHVQVDVDESRACASRRAHRGSPRSSWRRATSSRVDRPRARRRRASQRSRSRSGAGGVAQPRAQRRRRRRGARAGRRASRRRRGSNSRPCSPSPSSLLVDRQARGDRHRAGGERAHEHARARARRRSTRARRRRRARAARPRRSRRGPAKRDPLAQLARAAAPVGARRAARPDGRPPARVERQPPQRAQEQAQRGALLVGDEARSATGPSRLGAPRGDVRRRAAITR